MSNNIKGIEGLRILCDTTFEDYPDATIHQWVREAVKQHDAMKRERDEAASRADEILARLGESEAKLISVALTGSPFDNEALNRNNTEQQIKGAVWLLAWHHRKHHLFASDFECLDAGLTELRKGGE